MKKIAFVFKGNMLLILMVSFMLMNYGCQKKPVDLNQKELTGYINQIRSENWKNNQLKSKELQKLFGVLLYNQLPIKKDSITYKFHSVKGVIQNVGYFKNNDYVELNECYGISRWINLNYLNTDTPDNLFLQCTEYSRMTGKVNKESETIVDGNRITVTSFKEKSTTFRLYNSEGKILEEGSYKYVPTNTRDTIIEYNPFNYEEKIKLAEEKKVKSGIWRYFDKSGKIVSEKCWDEKGDEIECTD